MKNKRRINIQNLLLIGNVILLVITIIVKLANIDVRVSAISMLVMGLAYLIYVFKNKVKEFWSDTYFWTGLSFIFCSSHYLFGI